jgi:hypothetical protein
MVSVPGKRRKRPVEVPKDQQIIIPVPPIVTIELANAVHAVLQKNKEEASRHNSTPRLNLLRAGLTVCGKCGGSMHCARKRAKLADGTEREYMSYTCIRRLSFVDRCSAVNFPAEGVDDAAWQKALELIQDPDQIDKQIASLRSQDPTVDRRKYINTQLTNIRGKQAVFRQQLANIMMEENIDKGTLDFLKDQLAQLAKQEEGWNEQLRQEKGEQEKWKAIEERLTKIHKRCEENEREN